MVVPLGFRRTESIPGRFVHGRKQAAFQMCIAPFNGEFPP
jgi:hypothetical protein